MTTLRIIDATDRAALEGLFARAGGSDRSFDRRVRGIVDRVRTGGDRALAGFARRFDRVEPPFEVTPAEMHAQAARVAPDVGRAIAAASRHIARVARRQLPKTSRTTCGMRVTACLKTCLPFISGMCRPSRRSLSDTYGLCAKPQAGT